MNDKDFENYWKTHKKEILENNHEYKQVQQNYNMSSGADWILYSIPVIAGIVFMDYCGISHELLKWLASAAITIVCFIICVWIKSLITTKDSYYEVENKIKKEIREKLIDN